LFNGWFIEKALNEGIEMGTDEVNIDADGYYMPKIGEII
jgi:hypothetical protein